MLIHTEYDKAGPVTQRGAMKTYGSLPPSSQQLPAGLPPQSRAPRRPIVWDGTRPLTRRIIETRNRVTVDGAEFVYAAEQISKPTDWCIHEPHHVLVVHRSGQLNTLEVEIESGPSGRALPQVGDVWVIPASHQYAALAQGSAVQYCQIEIEPRMLPDVYLKPAVQQRDPLTHQLVEQIGTASRRQDIFSLLFVDWLAEALFLHLAHKLSGGSSHRPSPFREFNNATRLAILECLDAGPDADTRLQKLAALADMSVREFTRTFAMTFHTAPHQLLLSRRIVRAKQLLVSTSQSVTKIAVTLGFYDLEHFSGVFKRRVGLPPSGYRRAHRLRI